MTDLIVDSIVAFVLLIISVVVVVRWFYAEHYPDKFPNNANGFFENLLALLIIIVLCIDTAFALFFLIQDAGLVFSLRHVAS